jgi:hypothetical protein
VTPDAIAAWLDLGASGLLLAAVWAWATGRIRTGAECDRERARADAAEAKYVELLKEDIRVLQERDRTLALAAWTPTVASRRDIVAATPGVSLPAGTYWLLLKNNGAGNMNVGTAAAGTMALAAAQTKNLGTATVGATLDATAATWTKINTYVNVRLNGRVFGQAASF